MALSEHGGARARRRADNGPGISAEDQKVIFDKFRQVGDTLTDKPPGTGLGLHISRQIVEHFGGRMWVESRPGEGAMLLVHAARRAGARPRRSRPDRGPRAKEEGK